MSSFFFYCVLNLPFSAQEVEVVKLGWALDLDIKFGLGNGLLLDSKG